MEAEAKARAERLRQMKEKAQVFSRARPPTGSAACRAEPPRAPRPKTEFQSRAPFAR